MNDVKNANFVCDTDNPEINYDNLVQVLGSIIEKHAPLKQKIVRGNEAPFMNKELKQAIYRRSRLINITRNQQLKIRTIIRNKEIRVLIYVRRQ